MTITSERPGVYTSYQASSINYSNAARGVVGLVAVAEKGTAEQVYSITSALEARNTFGVSAMSRLAEILFQNGVSEIKAVPVFAENGSTAPNSRVYANSFALITKLEDVQIVLCDTNSSAVHSELKTAIVNSDNRNQHKIGIVEPGGGVEAMVENAAAQNCERIVMVAPGGVNTNGEASDVGAVAAAVAGAILSVDDPAVPLNGAELYGLGGVTTSFTESEIDTLVKGGVCPVESIGSKVSVIRGVTTYTTDESGKNDYTWHELTTVRIVDNIIPQVRDSLKTMFSRAKNTAQTRDAIRTQVVVILEKKLAAEIIDSYGSVSVTKDENDPTVCNVTFEFAVAHGINKIILTANITV